MFNSKFYSIDFALINGISYVNANQFEGIEAIIIQTIFSMLNLEIILSFTCFAAYYIKVCLNGIFC